MIYAGGSIDFNEFKGAFDTGTLAEAKRDSERNKKLKEEQLKKARRLVERLGSC
jgi:hypothetical protein